MTADAQTAEQTAVLTERRGNVLLITLNRPEVRNAVNAALAEGVGKALDELDADDGAVARRAHRRRRVLLRRHGPRRVREGRVAVVRRPRLRRDRPARRGEAADRRDRGLRGRGRHGDRARVRPDRRRGGREARHPGGQALARRRRRRAAAPAAPDALPRGDGAGADRRSVPGRALPRARPRQPPRRARAPRSTSRSSWRRRSPRTGRSRCSPRSRSCRSSGTGAPRRCGRSRARSPAR